MLKKGKYFLTLTWQSLKANLWRAKEIISRERPLALIFWFPADGKKGQGSNPVMAFSAQPAIKQVLVGACINVYKQYQSMQKQYTYWSILYQQQSWQYMPHTTKNVKLSLLFQQVGHDDLVHLKKMLFRTILFATGWPIQMIRFIWKNISSTIRPSFDSLEKVWWWWRKCYELKKDHPLDRVM